MSKSEEGLLPRLATPALTWVALMLLLGAISAIGALTPYDHWWLGELGCLFLMVVIVLVFSMEMPKHQPIVRLFSLLGFFWVGILFAFIMLDYLTR